MKVIIVGCGRVGKDMAIKLVNRGDEVTIVDRDPQAFSKLPQGMEFNCIVGTGIDEDTLIRAGIKTADYLVTVTKGDNTNIMVAQVARELLDFNNVVCRIVDPLVKEFYSKEIGLNCYCPTEISSNYYISELGVL